MNQITLAGVIDGDIEYSHESHGEKFYKFYFSTERKSGAVDTLKCVVSKWMVYKLKENEAFGIVGEVRTRNYDDYNGKRCVEVLVFVNEVLEYCGRDKNHIEIDGFICKEPIYRETPLGRKICDLLVASNRLCSKSDYIPCISWGRSAIASSILDIGEHILVQGRLQSRIYTKKLNETEIEERVAYEVSAESVKVINEKEDK